MKKKSKEKRMFTDKQKYNSLRCRVGFLRSDICYSSLGKSELEEFKQKLEEILASIEEKLKKFEEEK